MKYKANDILLYKDKKRKFRVLDIDSYADETRYTLLELPNVYTYREIRIEEGDFTIFYREQDSPTSEVDYYRWLSERE